MTDLRKDLHRVSMQQCKNRIIDGAKKLNTKCTSQSVTQMVINPSPLARRILLGLPIMGKRASGAGAEKPAKTPRTTPWASQMLEAIQTFGLNYSYKLLHQAVTCNL